VVIGCVALIASMVLFLLARGAYWQIVIAMTVDGFGVGCVYAVNPLQITGGVNQQARDVVVRLRVVGVKIKPEKCAAGHCLLDACRGSW